MHVIPVLMVQVVTVDMIHMAVVLNGFMTVTLTMLTIMAFVDKCFGMHLCAVLVVNVAVVLNGLITVTGQVLVIGSGMTIGHVCLHSGRVRDEHGLA